MAAAGYTGGGEYTSADELARALEDADGDLIKQIRTLREQLKEAAETEMVLKGQITDLKQKAAQNPVLTAANQQFSALAKVSDQEQRRTKLMELSDSQARALYKGLMCEFESLGAWLGRPLIRFLI